MEGGQLWRNEMELRDSIPLKSIKDHGSLHVPQQLSRETAFRLIKRGWIRWRRIDRRTKYNQPHGIVELTDNGERTLC
jgi:hypothetical protein